MYQQHYQQQPQQPNSNNASNQQSVQNIPQKQSGVMFSPPQHSAMMTNPQLVHPAPARPPGYVATQQYYSNVAPSNSSTPSNYSGVSIPEQNHNSFVPVYQQIPASQYSQPGGYHISSPNVNQPSHGNTGFPPFSGIMNDPRAQMGMQFGSRAFHACHEYVHQNIHRYISVPHLKMYFSVSVGYVLNKLRLLMFPFRTVRWDRCSYRSESGLEVYKPPREDIHAPDLYIPVMGFITYVLLAAVHNVLADKDRVFNPEVLGFASSKALFAIILEILLVKLGCYLFSVQAQIPILDLVCYSGYKFVGIVVSMLSSFPLSVMGYRLPVWVYWCSIFYTSAALGLFSLRSMRYIVIPSNSTSTIHGPQWRRRINFLVAVSLLQIISSWLLVIR